MCLYLDLGLGNAWAGQVKDVIAPCFMETSPIIAVENLGSVVPIGSKGTKKLGQNSFILKAWMLECFKPCN